MEQAKRSLLHLMCAIACARASPLATSLMSVKNSTHLFVYDTYLLAHWNGENDKKIKNTKLNS